jgi:two-component system cell cycle sensor histidine kinase/response regulator CckA
MTTQPVSNQGSATSPKGEVLIYIVDDEPMLVNLAELILKPDGYQIRKFYAPELALKSFLADSNLPRLLITDYAMGAMSGLELADACKRKHPGLKIIMLSGTAGPDIIVDAPVKIDRFLAKPYHANTLLQLVRTVLAE